MISGSIWWPRVPDFDRGTRHGKTVVAKESAVQPQGTTGITQGFFWVELMAKGNVGIVEDQALDGSGRRFVQGTFGGGVDGG